MGAKFSWFHEKRSANHKTVKILPHKNYSLYGIYNECTQFTTIAKTYLHTISCDTHINLPAYVCSLHVCETQPRTHAFLSPGDGERKAWVRGFLRHAYTVTCMNVIRLASQLAISMHVALTSYYSRQECYLAKTYQWKPCDCPLLGDTSGSLQI